jgi:hypothetical protein
MQWLHGTRCTAQITAAGFPLLGCTVTVLSLLLLLLLLLAAVAATLAGRLMAAASVESGLLWCHLQMTEHVRPTALLQRPTSSLSDTWLSQSECALLVLSSVSLCLSQLHG